jgi:integrase
MGKERRRSKGTGHLYKRSGWFHYQWIDPLGQRHTKALRTKDRKTALANVGDMEASVKAKDQEEVLLRSARLRRVINARPLPWSEVWKVFEATKPTGSAGTLHNYNRAVDELEAWCKAAHPEVEGLHHITAEIAEGFMASVWSRGVSANRFNYIRGALMLVTSRLAKAHGLPNPWTETERRDDPARGRQKRKPLSVKQTTELLTLLDNPQVPVMWRGDMRLLFRLGLFTGMREKDAALLRWNDTDIGRRMLCYTPHKTRGKAITAEVPMIPEVAGEIVARWNAREQGQDYVLPDIAAEYLRTGK